MSASTLDQKSTAEASPSVPLEVAKQPSFKIIGMVVLLCLIIMANYFFFHHGEADKTAVKKEETYDTSYLNPLSDAAQTTGAEVNPPLGQGAQTSPVAAAETVDMEKALAEAKAKDFIERVQASQHGGGSVGGSSYSANTGSNSTDNLQVDNNADGNSLNTAASERIDDPNTAFLVAASNSKAERSYATHYGNLPYVIGQGKFIFANLAVAINSDLPGQISALVSQDVYGEQGRKILIPKGSLLIGEYKSGLSNNQSRLFVVWTRLREPNGIDIMLGSGGTDTLGRAGMTGNVDYHFFARFGTASLIAMIGAGAANIGVGENDQYNSAADYRQQVAGALAQQATNILNQSINIPPTINIPQGEKIVVFINKDLDFSRVYR